MPTTSNRDCPASNRTKRKNGASFPGFSPSLGHWLSVELCCITLSTGPSKIRAATRPHNLLRPPLQVRKTPHTANHGARTSPAPVTNPNSQVPESASAVPEHPPQPVTTAPSSEAVKTEPTIALPALTVDQLFQRLHARNGGGDLIDKRVRIRGKIEKLDENEVSFVGHDGSLTYWFDVRGLGETDFIPESRRCGRSPLCTRETAPVPGIP